MNKYHIPSIANTCSIFQLLTTSKKAMSSSAIANELNLPRTSVYRILQTLESEGMVQKINNAYIMGHRLINLGFQVTSHIPERQLCVPILQELTNQTQESSHFAVLSDTNSLLIEVCDSPQALRVASRPGTLADIHCSASGKCFLAFAPEQVASDLMDRITFTQRTNNTHINKASLMNELPTVRRLGYALDNIEYHENVRCIAAPVFNGLGQVSGAIGITASTNRFPKSRIPEMSKQVLAAAEQLSQRFGKH
ncbi:IclR family transcriptional regulator [Rubritalea tangerina]|uniref:IclR family transcriptional regulator n=1 Tax=Rubritalea tangerina TaxID=430798 RepID=A0ABW4ZF73_9BACT